jgi:hypothetical protein
MVRVPLRRGGESQVMRVAAPAWKANLRVSQSRGSAGSLPLPLPRHRKPTGRAPAQTGQRIQRLYLRRDACFQVRRA